MMKSREKLNKKAAAQEQDTSPQMGGMTFG